MKSALVAISTTGTRKETFDVINHISKSLNGIGVKPVFSICSDNRQIFADKPFKDTVCFSLKKSGSFDYTYYTIEAIQRGVEAFEPDFISTISDDFVLPAKKFKNVISPLLNGLDATFGSWGSNKIASTYPKFQYVSELFVNRIANFALKSSNLNYKNLLSYSSDYKSDFSDMVQIFTGIFAFRKESWASVLDKMLEIFGSEKLRWSLEVALLLISVETGLNIKNVVCNREKEINPPISGERTTRIIQMKDVFEHTNVFLKYSKQYEKLKEITEVQSQMIKIVETLLRNSKA